MITKLRVVQFARKQTARFRGAALQRLPGWVRRNDISIARLVRGG
jgi:hypothetical protein